MSSSSESSPPVFHPVSSLDPDMFKEEEEHYALTIKKQLTGKIMSSYKQLLLNKPKVRNVHTPASSPDLRVIVLSTLTSQGAASLDPSISKLISDSPDDDVKLSTHTVASTYSDMTVDSVLRRVIPESVTTEIPSSFESVGHIAHVNLRENVLPWKFIIGKVLLDKNYHITKVVNKVGQISTEFRTFPMEVIAGPDDNNFEVKLKEGGVQFCLDFEKVYWNSKLQYEHRRLVDRIAGVEHGGAHKKSEKRGDVASSNSTVVADVMAGIGPFAIPLGATHKIKVLANDLNPVSFEYLKKNAKINKCEKHVEPYNMDGRAFIHKLGSEKTKFDHAIMNLPAIAVEFLDAFRGWDVEYCRPTVHVHCFVKNAEDDEVVDFAKERCENALGCKLSVEEDGFETHLVRDVAPKKPMLCVSFKLPHELAKLEQVDLSNYKFGIRKGAEKDEPDVKRRKLN
ncbi:hypothetical protein TrVE_jg4488 [Triparma verrucosa]|uniref:tRNA (guanine(37)-N1)-methyltransferase n=1 Tax=Triparma verrucosa TaxID=1606542 RepID=A0A9W6Z7G4_9STRA|nr:hypothetical protein TrVE_jg4488 [Triparma verrucosa]